MKFRYWYLWTLLVVGVGMLIAEDAKTTQPTVVELQEQIKAKDAKILWLEQRLQASEMRSDALAKFYQADAMARNLDDKKPVEPPTKMAIPAGVAGASKNP